MKNELVAINMIAETIDVNIKSVYKTLALAGDTFKCRTQGNNYYCYVFVIKGTMKFQLRQPYQFELAEGQATFLWGNDFETYFFDEETEYFWVYFSLTEKKLMVMRPFSIDDIEGTVKDFHRCANLLNRSTKLDLSRANMIFTKHVLDGIEKMRAEEISSKSYHRAVIEKSVNYIKENLGNLPTIQELASLVGMSLKQYRKHFKKIIGEYPAKFIYEQKLLMVRDSLVHTDLSIAQISDFMNFSSSYYLSSCFKNKFGCTPMEYRKKFRE